MLYLMIASFVLIVLAAMQSVDVNKQINRINEENSSRYNVPRIPTASYSSLILAAVLLLVAILLSVFGK